MEAGFDSSALAAIAALVQLTHGIVTKVTYLVIPVRYIAFSTAMDAEFDPNL